MNTTALYINCFIHQHSWRNTALLWNILECTNPTVISVIQKKTQTLVMDLVVESHSSVHMGAFLLVVTGCLHHVLWVTEQSQVHQLVIQAILLITHSKSQEATERDRLKDTWKCI